MKKLIAATVMIVMCSINVNSQVFRIGLKAGPNFSNFSGGVSGLNYSSRTSVHAGVATLIGIGSRFAVAPELLYSSEGAKVEGIGDFNLEYVSLPILAKIYIMPDKFSIDLGPQFSYLIKDSDEVLNEVTTESEIESFDFAVAGGVTLNVTKNIFAQARYTLGITEASKEAEVKNTVIQFSIGYMFF